MGIFFHPAAVLWFSIVSPNAFLQLETRFGGQIRLELVEGGVWGAHFIAGTAVVWEGKRGGDRPHSESGEQREGSNTRAGGALAGSGRVGVIGHVRLFALRAQPLFRIQTGRTPCDPDSKRKCRGHLHLFSGPFGLRPAWLRNRG